MYLLANESYNNSASSISQDKGKNDNVLTGHINTQQNWYTSFHNQENPLTVQFMTHTTGSKKKSQTSILAKTKLKA